MSNILLVHEYDPSELETYPDRPDTVVSPTPKVLSSEARATSDLGPVDRLACDGRQGALSIARDKKANYRLFLPLSANVHN